MSPRRRALHHRIRSDRRAVRTPLRCGRRPARVHPVGRSAGGCHGGDAGHQLPFDQPGVVGGRVSRRATARTGLRRVSATHTARDSHASAGGDSGDSERRRTRGGGWDLSGHSGGGRIVCHAQTLARVPREWRSGVRAVNARGVRPRPGAQDGGSRGEADLLPANRYGRTGATSNDGRAISRPSRSRTPAIVRIFGAALKAWWDDDALRLGESLAYYTLFAIAPILLVATGIAGLVVNTD